MTTKTSRVVSPRESARRMAGLAQAVGGRSGKILRQLAALAANGGPDLTVRTRTAVSTQAAAVLRALGGYSPDDVSLETMKRMRRDPQLRLAMAATRAPILEAPIFFESKSREAVALCEAAWSDSGVLRSLQRTSLQALEFGYAAHELLWEAQEGVEITWSKPGDMVGSNDVVEKTFPHLFMPRVPKDLDPSMVTLLQDDFGRFQGLVFGGGDVVMTDEKSMREWIAQNRENYLPPEKTFLFTHEGDWGNLYGVGRYASAYDPWFWQKIIYLVCNRWYERKSDPPYLGYAPSDPALAAPENNGTDTDYDPTDEVRSPILKLRSLVENVLRSSGVLILPSEPYKDDDGKPSNIRAYDLKEMGIEDIHPAFLEYIQHLDVKKTRAMLVPDGAIAASENSGTYGSTQTLSALAVKIQNETLDVWIRHFNDYALKRFLAYNGIKDRVVARTTGISQDNRDVLASLAERTFEADMLLEQRWGPQFGDSMSRLVDRRKLLRGLGMPFTEPEPGQPPPKLPTPPPEPTPAGGGSGSGSEKPPKRKTGLSAGSSTKPRVRRMLDVASSDFVSWAQARADEFETRAVGAAAEAPYRNVIDEHRKAVAAIILWLLLRTDKTDGAGKPKKGLKKVDRLVFDTAGKVFPASKLAEVLPDLERMAADYEGSALRIDSTSARPLMSKAQRAIESSLSGLPSAAQKRLDPAKYLSPALEEATATMRNILERFDSDEADGFAALDASEAGTIVALNSRGLLWNIENIAIRNTRSLVEKLINDVGNRRRLGVVGETITARFNELYTDLSLEAHYRAVFRGAMVALAEKNGYAWMLMVSTAGDGMSMGSEYVGTVRTIDDWERLGERHGEPHSIRQFGFHPGSRSYWFPVPTNARLRNPATREGEALAVSVIKAGREREAARKAARK